ncbi:MAG: hypothetical protein SF028_14645 [Candidatus Sumerlaeia bacterium]|nr:hypothetical protein [Candidatus Sumerlaeia bacterium]
MTSKAKATTAKHWRAFLQIFGLRHQGVEHPLAYLEILEKVRDKLAMDPDVRTTGLVEEFHLECDHQQPLLDALAVMQNALLCELDVGVATRGVIFRDEAVVESPNGVRLSEKLIRVRSTWQGLKTVGFVIAPDDAPALKMSKSSNSPLALVNFCAGEKRGSYERFYHLSVGWTMDPRYMLGVPGASLESAWDSFFYTWLSAAPESEKLSRFYVPFAVNWLEHEGNEMLSILGKASRPAEFPSAQLPILSRLVSRVLSEKVGVSAKLELVGACQCYELFLLKLADICFSGAVEDWLAAPENKNVLLRGRAERQTRRAKSKPSLDEDNADVQPTPEKMTLASALQLLRLAACKNKRLIGLARKDASGPVPLEILSIKSRRNFIRALADSLQE